jgi:nucleoid-associated protein YgaU
MSDENNNEEKRDDAQETAPAVSSRLGREAKIGVTVIVLLLIAFGAAVGVRLKGLSGGNAIASESQSGTDKLNGSSTTDALLQGTKSKYFAGSSPTVISAKAASAQPPKTTAADADPWKLVSDRDDSKRAAGGRSLPNTPPSFMPDPPKSSHADRTEPRAFAPPAATDRQPQAFTPAATDRQPQAFTPAAREREPQAFTPAARDREPRVLDAPVAKPLADAKPLRRVDSGMQPVVPDEGVRPVSGQDPSLTSVSSPAAASAPALLSPSSAAVPAEPSPPPQPPASLSTSPSYSPAPVSSSPAPMPVTQLAADDYRREPAPPRFSSNSEPRRAVASSSNPPARRDDGKYEVQPNDSYWTISEKVYGMGAYFKALAQHNRGKATGEDRLTPGELILAPPVAELEKLYPLLCPRASRREAQQSQTQSRLSSVGLRSSGRGGRTYTVVEGDTLFNIARNELGKATRWAEIYDLNREVLGKDFNYLTPGTQLSLPEGQKTDVTAQPPSDSLRR